MMFAKTRIWNRLPLISVATNSPWHSLRLIIAVGASLASSPLHAPEPSRRRGRPQRAAEGRRTPPPPNPSPAQVAPDILAWPRACALHIRKAPSHQCTPMLVDTG